MPPKRKRVQPPRVSTRGSTILEVNSQMESTQMASEVDSQYRRRYETPPVFNPEEITYDEWKTALDDWCHLTGTPLEDQGTAVRMHLLGSARQAAQHVDVVDIRSKQGVKKLLVELDRVFIPDAMVREMLLLHKLFRTVRPTDKPVGEFLNEFSDQYLKVRQAGQTLPDKILSYLLLSACDMGVDKMQLILSSLNGSVAFDDMKHQIKLISSVDVLAQKTQQNEIVSSGSDTFINKNDNDEKVESTTLYSNRQFGPPRGYSRGRSNFNRRNFRPRNRSASYGRNPLNIHGIPMRCLRCESVYHLVRNCPESSGSRRPNEGGQRRNDRNDMNRRRDNFPRDHEVNYSYLFVGCASSEEDRLQQLINDTLGYAVLDSGCANSVTGENWFKEYEKQLSETDAKAIRIAPSDEFFTFGDGKKVKSMRKVTFPCWFGGKRGLLTVDIVDCNIPLLMSRKAMSRAKMRIDFGNDSAFVGGRNIRLKITRSGHYAIPISL